MEAFLEERQPLLTMTDTCGHSRNNSLLTICSLDVFSSQDTDAPGNYDCRLPGNTLLFDVGSSPVSHSTQSAFINILFTKSQHCIQMC